MASEEVVTSKNNMAGSFQVGNFLRPKGLALNFGNNSSALQRVRSKQDYDMSIETYNLKQSTVGIIEERHSPEEHDTLPRLDPTVPKGE